MTSIQEVYSTPVSEFIQLVKLCDYEVCCADAAADIFIVKGSDKSDNEVRPPVKGLIFKGSTGEIIAPGIAPLLDSTLESPIGYSPAIDGVLFRIYRYNGKVHWSTAGMFNPAKGHWGSSTTFGTMINDVKSQVNESCLKDGLCYFAMLEHSDQPGVYRPADRYAMLTLIRVVSLDGTVHPMQDLAASFQSVFSRVLEYRPGVPSETDLAFLTESLPASPVDYDKYGMVFYYQTGFPVRALSNHAKEAASLSPNFPMVWQHWIYCMTHGGLDAINRYVAFFPWCASEFNMYTERWVAFNQTHPETLTNKEIKSIILAEITKQHPTVSESSLKSDEVWADATAEPEKVQDHSENIVTAPVPVPTSGTVPVPAATNAQGACLLS